MVPRVVVKSCVSCGGLMLRLPAHLVSLLVLFQGLVLASPLVKLSAVLLAQPWASGRASRVCPPRKGRTVECACNRHTVDHEGSGCPSQ